MLTKKDLLLDFIRHNRRVIIGAFLFSLLSILVSIFIPIFIGKFYEIVLHSRSARGKFFNAIFGKKIEFQAFIILFFLLLFVKFLFSYLEELYIGISSELFSKKIREKLFAKQLITDYSVFHKKDTGKYLLRYSGDLTSIRQYLSKGIIAFIKDCLFLTFTLIVFSLINLNLTMIIISSFPIVFIIIYFLNNKKLKPYTRRRRNVRSSILSFASSRLNAMITIKVFNRESIESEKFDKKSSKLYSYGVVYYRWYALISALLPFLLYIILMFLLIYIHDVNSGKRVVHGSTILVFIMLTINAIPVMRRVIRVNIIWQAGDISFNKILQVFNSKEENKSKSENEKVERGSISFQDVSFGFYDSKMIFEKLTFDIKEKGITILEGDQGSGKTTLFNLILGIYNPNEGFIYVGGEDISKMSKHVLRKSITMISSDLPLIGETIFEAISYSRKEEKRKDAEEVLFKLGFSVDDKTDSILNYPLKGGGRNLSTGQRKLLLIARALLSRKKIILAEEPFIDLDDENKKNVIDLINGLKSKRTILIISKNIEPEIKYDNIIQLSLPRLNLN